MGEKGAVLQALFSLWRNRVFLFPRTGGGGGGETHRSQLPTARPWGPASGYRLDLEGTEGDSPI